MKTSARRLRRNSRSPVRSFFSSPKGRRPVQDWALDPTIETKNCISSIYMNELDLEAMNIHHQKKYALIAEKEQRSEGFMLEDAEYVLVGYGISARMSRTAVEELRKSGIKAGLLRPQTLFPFPEDVLKKLVPTTKMFFSVEMSNGQMIDDIRLAIECARPVKLINRMGGVLLSAEEIFTRVSETVKTGEQKNG